MTDKVLFVDDDAKILAALRRRLRKQFAIDTVLGGREGLELLATEGPYAVVVADYCMPHMNGIEFLSRVRSVAPESVRMMLTGSADLQSAIQAVNEGNIFRFLTKPCATETLSEALCSGIAEFRRTSAEKAFNRITRRRLAQAKEVQKNLTPDDEAGVEGMDIAGHSLYCDETSGDYYDYFGKTGTSAERVAVVVGDVSDHGVPSALLMTTARAFLRERAVRAGGVSEIVSDVNRQLTRDIKTSNRFMTLFYGEIDVHNRNIRWVRAGHDPAVLYDPSTGSFSELAGQGGLPLGVFEESTYEEYFQDLVPGHILLVGTDGIWEGRNSSGQAFGKEKIKAILRREAESSARAIVRCIIDAFEKFIYPRAVEDDATIVVMKLLR